MKSLKSLFANEIRSSMRFLCIGIAFSVSCIVGYFQYQQLRFDFQFTEQFILETTRNAISLEQPIIFQRSILEFWKAFQQRDSSIEGIEVSIGEALVSQAGYVQSNISIMQFETERCFAAFEKKFVFTISWRQYDLLRKFFIFYSQFLPAQYVFIFLEEE